MISAEAFFALLAIRLRPTISSTAKFCSLVSQPFSCSCLRIQSPAALCASVPGIRGPNSTASRSAHKLVVRQKFLAFDLLWMRSKRREIPGGSAGRLGWIGQCRISHNSVRSFVIGYAQALPNSFPVSGKITTCSRCVRLCSFSTIALLSIYKGWHDAQIGLHRLKVIR